MRRFAIVCLLGCLQFAALADDYLPPLEFGPTNQYGAHLQRSLRLMQSSSPEKKRTVRVLFYGQSIIQQAWTRWVTDSLRARYPNANLVVTNLAVGGYTSDVLSRPAPADICNFYPDLMIFHDFGPDASYEDIIELTRRRTTADILIQTDHIYHDEELNELTDLSNPAALTPVAYHNYVTLPAIAQRYGAELADIRTYWRKYLLDYNLPVSSLLVDGIHPNLNGNYLFRDLVEPYLREDDSFSSAEWADAERNYLVGRDLNWTNDVLRLPFVGNRIDVIVSDSGSSPVQVRIDGRPPSSFPELYSFTRPDLYPGTTWLALLSAHSRSPLQAEQWSVQVLESHTNSPLVRFALHGSKTGDDGEGDTLTPFVSNSGRVLFDTLDWLMLYWVLPYYPAVQPLPVGSEINWSSQFNGQDQFVPTVNQPDLETTITVAQGLANGPHTLELTRTGAAPIAGIRVYNPLARVQPAEPGPVQLSAPAAAAGTFTVRISTGGRYVLESSPDCVNWETLTAPIADAEYSLPVESGARFLRARPID